jgi:hypothetical protein
MRLFCFERRRRHSENFNEKLKLAGALNSAPAALRREKRNCCSTAAVVAPYGHALKLPRNTP